SIRRVTSTLRRIVENGSRNFASSNNRSLDAEGRRFESCQRPLSRFQSDVARRLSRATDARLKASRYVETKTAIMPASWNQIAACLKQIDAVRCAAWT